MIARLIFCAAIALSVISLWGLRHASESVPHQVLELEGGLPVVVYRPERATSGSSDDVGPLPVLVLAHGYAEDAAMLSTLARHLVRSGYAVVTPELRGHGRHPRPLPLGIGVRDAPRQTTELIEDLEAAVLFARTFPGFDAERVAVGGHGLGAEIALDYASRDPGVGAVVALSGVGRWSGPHSPPNVLFVTGSNDSPALLEQARRAGAALAELRQVVTERTYGSFDRGRALKTSEIDAAGHWSILYRAATGERIADWLERSIGPGAVGSAGPSVGRATWSLLAGIALALLLWSAALRLRFAASPGEGLEGPGGPATAALDAPPETSSARAPEPPSLARRLANVPELLLALSVGAVWVTGPDEALGAGPLSLLPLGGARDLVATLALTGVALCAAWPLRGSVRLRSGREPRALLLGLGWFAAIYVVGGAALAPWTQTSLAWHRLLPAALVLALAFPFFLVVEARFRGTPGWTALAGSWGIRAILLGLFGLSYGLGVWPPEARPALYRLGLMLLAFEGFAFPLTLRGPHPWFFAVVQSAWLAWILGTSAPVDRV